MKKHSDTRPSRAGDDLSGSSLEVAAIQLTSVDNIEVNFEQMSTAVTEALKSGPLDLISFPENCLYQKVLKSDPLAGISPDHEVFTQLQAMAQSQQVFLHLGGVPLQEDGRVTNATIIISPTGQTKVVYRKAHLFDVDVEGQSPVRESDFFKAGNELSLIELQNFSFGMSICYDLRFSALYWNYALAGAEVIFVPAAFLVTTGRAHWETLIRARAIEGQCYVIAAAQGGTHQSVSADSSRQTFGQSMIVDPWGRVLGQAWANIDSTDGDHVGSRVVRATVQKSVLNQVKTQIPMAQHRYEAPFYGQAVRTEKFETK